MSLWHPSFHSHALAPSKDVIPWGFQCSVRQGTATPHYVINFFQERSPASAGPLPLSLVLVGSRSAAIVQDVQFCVLASFLGYLHYRWDHLEM
eukprot:scaffold105290_cov13-Tisochrysis_lutea.AAC.2